MSQSLYAVFNRTFQSRLDHVLMETEDGRRLSYADAIAASGRMASLLVRLGVKPGDRVAVQVEKSPEAVFLYLACLRSGAIYLPLNTAYTVDELDYFLEDAAPTVVVVDPAATARLAPIAERHKVGHLLTLAADGSGSLSTGAASEAAEFTDIPRAGDDLAAILYTSGTTGRPKGAMLTQSNLASNAAALVASWGFRPDDVLLHALPIFHAHGLFVAINCTLLNGSTMIFLPRFDPGQVISLLPRASLFMGVPTFYTRLLSRADFTADVCRTIRLFVSGSAPLLTETFDDFAARTGQRILERYGMTETAMNTSNPLDGERIAGTVGYPLPGITVRVTDDQDGVLPAGEIGAVQVKGPNVFCGYWRKPDATAKDFTADGWFRTGDLGLLSPDGRLSLVGRAKDLIISGGYNVYPKEIETILDEMPGIAESAVIGMPHPDFGEAGLAVITLQPGATAPESVALLAALREKLANFKVPKQVVIATDLPRNTMGKVQKNLLRSQYADHWAAQLRH